MCNMDDSSEEFLEFKEFVVKAFNIWKSGRDQYLTADEIAQEPKDVTFDAFVSDVKDVLNEVKL